MTLEALWNWRFEYTFHMYAENNRAFIIINAKQKDP